MADMLAQFVQRIAADAVRRAEQPAQSVPMPEHGVPCTEHAKADTVDPRARIVPPGTPDPGFRWHGSCSSPGEADRVLEKNSEHDGKTAGQPRAEDGKFLEKAVTLPANRIGPPIDPPEPHRNIEREEMFVKEYLVDFNGTQAAIRAGYSVKGAGAQALRLLRRPHIYERIKTAISERQLRTQLRSDVILRELVNIATVDPLDCLDDMGSLRPLSEIPEHTRRAIACIQVEDLKGGGQRKTIRFWDKVRAVELGMKHLGLLQEKVQLQVSFEEIVKKSLPARDVTVTYKKSE
jgi:phage terminase small subunit